MGCSFAAEAGTEGKEQASEAPGASESEAARRAAALSAITELDERQPGTLQRMLEQVPATFVKATCM